MQEAGESVDQRDIDDVAPISRAVEAGNLPVVIYLLSKGADVEARDAYLLRPVHYAASLGHTTILRVLASRLPSNRVAAKGGNGNGNGKHIPGLEVRKNVFLKPFLYINDHFTKTGSGQT